MRLEETAKSGQFKVWMDEYEFRQLERVADTSRDRLIIELAGRVGLRAFEIPQICPTHVHELAEESDYRLHVPSGKNITGTGGTSRDAYLPMEVERHITRFQTENNIGSCDPLITLTERSIRQVIKRTADHAADQTGDQDFRHVSYHDLRRRFAHRLLLENRLEPRFVMKVGGWDSFQALDRYLQGDI